MTTVLSTAYFPPVVWMAHVVQGGELWMEAHENFQKQSYRSRSEICGPQGKQLLSVPVDRSEKQIERIGISYKEDWVKNHLKTIETAYANSPFFEVLYPDIEAILLENHKTLWSLNKATVDLFLQWLDLPKEFARTHSYQRTSAATIDARDLHPKHPLALSYPEYAQVFREKNGFISNLSAMDVFFNLGRGSWDYFQELDLQQK